MFLLLDLLRRPEQQGKGPKQPFAWIGLVEDLSHSKSPGINHAILERPGFGAFGRGIDGVILNVRERLTEARFFENHPELRGDVLEGTELGMEFGHRTGSLDGM